MFLISTQLRIELIEISLADVWSSPIPGRSNCRRDQGPVLESTRLARSKAVRAMPVHDDRFMNAIISWRS